MYKRFNWLSIFLIFMLFVLGGLVRSTGSGMGCPDWPKCFGEYIPPTSADDLPENYEDFFTQQRIKKSERFSKLLDALGMKELAIKVQAESANQQSHTYNSTKAYIEYINRLAGALTGIIVFIALLLSFKYLRTKPWVFVFTLLGFVFVFVNALLGAVVVNTNLLSGIVTAHFLAAFAAMSFFMIARSRLSQAVDSRKYNAFELSIVTSLLGVILCQIVIGTQVRSSYDLAAEINGLNAFEQIRNFLALKTNAYPIHRILAFVVIGLGFLQYFKLEGPTEIKKYSLIIAVLAIAQVVVGIAMIFGIGIAFSKLFHISAGAAIFVLQFYICTAVFKTKNQLEKS